MNDFTAHISLISQFAAGFLSQVVPEDIGFLNLKSTWQVLQQLGWRIIPLMLHGIAMFVVISLALVELYLMARMAISRTRRGTWANADLEALIGKNSLRLVLAIAALFALQFPWDATCT